jgi:hypothetical protein
MLLVMNIECEIAGLKFKRVVGVRIEESTSNLSKTATIHIPRTATMTRQGKFVTEVETAKEFPTGSTVVIRLGYNGQLQEEFRGYVKSVRPGDPVTIECEDEMYILRKKRINKSWRMATLRDVLHECLRGSGITIQEPVPNILFKPFYIHDSNAAAALQKLKENLGLVIRLTSPTTLYVSYSEQNDDTKVTLKITENVISDALEWVDERDVTLKAKAISIRKDNTRLEAEVGDPDGDQRTLYFYNIDTTAELKEIATRELQKYKYTGVRGELTTFLIPTTRPGMTALIRDPIFTKRSGDYLVDKVVTTFDERGGRRNIYPGLKVNV